MPPSESEGPAGPQRGPLYAVIAAFFVPFLAVLFPYLVLDDYRRTRALVAVGARSVADPKRAPRKHDGVFYAAGAVWLGTLVAIPIARAQGANTLTAVLLTVHLVSASISTLLLITSWFRSDRRSPQEKQAQFAVREAQLVAFFEQRDAERTEAGVAFSAPAVPWVSRGVWRRWFLVRWDPEAPPLDANLSLGEDQRAAADHATPVPSGELDSAPVAEIVGDWAPRRAEGWEPAPKPPEKPLSELEVDVTTRTPSPFRFPGMSWPVCHSRLAVMIWEGNVGLPPDGIGLPMGVPEHVEALITEAQGTAVWDTALGWDGHAVFQCSDCGRMVRRGYEA